MPESQTESPFVVLAGHPPPWGYLPIPPVPPEEHGIERPVSLVPQGGPVQPPVHLQHQREGLCPQGGWEPRSSPGPSCSRSWRGAEAPLPPVPALFVSPAPRRRGRAGRRRLVGSWRRGGWGGLKGIRAPKLRSMLYRGRGWWWWVWCPGICWMSGGVHRTARTFGSGASPPPFRCGWCPLPFPSPPSPGPHPPCLRWPAPPPPWPLAPARPLPPAALPISLTVPRIPSASVRALAIHMSLFSPAAACAFALPVPLPPSAAARALALSFVPAPPPAAARASARPWRLPPSSAACHHSTVAFLPLPCVSALCPSAFPIAVCSVSSGPRRALPRPQDAAPSAA